MWFVRSKMSENQNINNTIKYNNDWIIKLYRKKKFNFGFSYNLKIIFYLKIEFILRNIEKIMYI